MAKTETENIRQSGDKKLKFAFECIPCPDCDEPYCEDCKMHYADCFCIGPDEDIEPEEMERLLREWEK